MLTATGLSLAHGSRVLFSDVTLSLSPGRRVALVGANGQGKTSLLDILVENTKPDSGSITKPKDMRIGYLAQEIPTEDDGSVLDTVLGGRPDIMHLHHTLAAGPTDTTPEALDRYGDAQTRFEQLNGYAFEAEAHGVLAGLGFATEDADRPVAALSGGWRMRVALARLLLSSPDLLILDEPTNHLDLDSVGWLEARLKSWTGSLLFVSHDRDFIDNIATHVVELANETLTEYVGGFAEFVVEREERIERLQAQAASQAKQRAQTEKFVERFRYKATKARQVQSRIKMLEKLEKIEVPERKELQARFQFPEPPRTSRVVAELKDMTAGYGDSPVLRDVSIHVERGQKLALVGPNGAGKTTLLKMLLGDLPPMEGTAEVGQSVTVARFEQHQADELDPDQMVLEVARDGIGSDTPRGKSLRTYLASFGFRDDAVERRVGVLSGGERTRLALAKVMAEPAGLLILDEPTNHLDLASCDMLEDALSVYPGTVLLVTHDRYLIRSVADDVVDVRDGTAVFHHGVPESVLNPTGPTTRRDTAGNERDVKKTAPKNRAAKKQAKTQKAATPSPTPTPTPKKKPATDPQKNRELRKQVNRLEKKWEQAEARVAVLQAELADPDVYADTDKLVELQRRHDAAKDEAASLMAEWEHAATQLESVDS